MQDVDSPPAFLPQRSIQSWVLQHFKWCVMSGFLREDTCLQSLSLQFQPGSNLVSRELWYTPVIRIQMGTFYSCLGMTMVHTQDLGQSYGLVEQHDWVGDPNQKLLERCSLTHFLGNGVLSTFCPKEQPFIYQFKID